MTERPPPGPLAEEAAKLVEVALGWARRAAVAYGDGQPGSASSGPASSGGTTGEAAPVGHIEGGTCRACPLCRASAALRDPSPELGERLTAAVTDAALAFADVLRVLSDAGVGGERGEPRAAAPAERPDRSARQPARPTVERIDLEPADQHGEVRHEDPDEG